MESRIIHCEVAVIGAGPAGLCAAIQLAEVGVETVIVDEKPAAGGQLFKQIHKFFGSEHHLAGVRGFEIGKILLERCRELRVPIHLNTAAWGIFPDKAIGTSMAGWPVTLSPRKIILATGASENPLAFPGWTLPGVMGAGAAQTLVNYHRVRPGNRALIVGAGNVGLIVAYQLLQAGIEVAAVVEGLEQVGGYMVHAAKIRRMSVPIFTRHTITSAEGDGRLQRCTIAEIDRTFTPIPGTDRRFDVDLICVAVGLSPAVELCAAMGAELSFVRELGGWLPLHNESLMTSIDGVYVAGDVSGIAEASSAMEEGKRAAVAAAAALNKIKPQAADTMIREIQRHLALLRQGPFGRLIGQKKSEVFERYQSQCRMIA